MDVRGGRLCPALSLMLHQSQVERCKNQDDSYIRHQPFPEPIPEEQEIHTDHDGCQQHYIKYDRCISRHFSHQLEF
jgi:hypothetical protein